MKADSYECDEITTAEGPLRMTFLGHGSLMFEFNGRFIYIDPYSGVADYTTLPKADLILLTHEHDDHLDQDALQALTKPDTHLILTEKCHQQLSKGEVLHNNESTQYDGITIDAVPAYNIAHRRPDGNLYHPAGEGNGYVLTFADQRVYVAGDTENIPEMAHLRNIDIAFLPMNLPYTMTPEMVADATSFVRPKILYPYHYGKTDVSELLPLLAEVPDTLVRIRKLA